MCHDRISCRIAVAASGLMAGPKFSKNLPDLALARRTPNSYLPRHGTLPLPHFLGWGSPSRDRGGRRPLSPQFRGRSFPRSTLAPGSDSRRLYAGCRPSSEQVSLGLITSLMSDSLLTSFNVLLDALPAVHSFVRLSDPYLTTSRIAFSATFTTPAVVPAQLAVVCSLPLHERLRRAYLHHQRSMALVLPIYIGSPPPSWHKHNPNRVVEIEGPQLTIAEPGLPCLNGP